MRLALFSDIHANRQAFDACLEHAGRAGVDQYAFLGDMVGYGADPAYVVRRVMALAAQGALVVKGNHDQYASDEQGSARLLGLTGIGWTRAQLGADELAFLAALPLTLRAGSVLLVHASADAPSSWRYVDSTTQAALSLDGACLPPDGHADVRYVFGGHVHMQTLYFRGSAGKLMQLMPTPGEPVPVPRHNHWLATVGSVGQPRDGSADAMYALLDDARQQLTFHRVPYDVQAAAAAIRATPMPTFFADRLEIGR